MPIEKQSLNNFLPDGFETLNQEGYKVNFSEDKIKTGYEKDIKDRVSGPNLNNLIDVVGKNTNTLNNYVEYLNGMPINNVPTTDENGQLNYINLDDKLTKKQITNCILEIPQRIKYTLENGTLTIKAGSVVIVPYGVEDLTAQHPIGAIFLNDNFKVYDTQFEDGKFFVWAEVQNDIVSNNSASTTEINQKMCLTINDNHTTWQRNTESGTSTSTATQKYTIYYNTETNLVGMAYENVNIDYTETLSLIFLETTCLTSNAGWKSVDQVFNGMGYIGSTIWIDKDVKCLMPDGRNEDGTLKNIEYEFKNIAIIDNSKVSMTYQQAEIWYSPDANNIYLSNVYYEQENTPIINTSHALWFNPTENIVKTTSNNGETWVQTGRIFLGLLSTDKTVKNLITSVTFSKTFKAVNYYDKPMVSGWGMPSNKYIDLTLGASKSSYVAPANGWIYISKKASGAGQYIFISGKGSIEHRSHSSSDIIKMMHPIAKGQTFYVEYTLGGATSTFQFIYAEGEI